MSWIVEGTDEFQAWYAALDDVAAETVDLAVQLLIERGPGLGRPFVDTIKSSRHSNMKELRPMAGDIRILFVFDPRRTAILLIGGDKTNNWTGWYRRMIPIADDLYDMYLDELRAEGLI